MNLNPLKKDNNTDALVKALEDANSMSAADQSSAAQPAADAGTNVPIKDATQGAVLDSAIIASDPQITGAGDPAASVTVDGSLLATNEPPKDDASTSLTFEGNDLPAGLSSDADAHVSTSATGDDSEIESVKKSALEQLRPLIEKLDLEPSDKFDKYLMMLRASDDPVLIKPAFEAAEKITGEKEKAQALLDVINEINYITASKQQ